MRTTQEIFQPLNEITQSTIATFLTCQQKYVFQYLMRLRKLGINIPLIIGSAVHDAMQILLDPNSSTTHCARLPVAHKAIDKIFDAVTAKTDEIQPGMDDKLEHSRAVAYACFEAWYIVFGLDIVGWKVQAVEYSKRATRYNRNDLLATISYTDRLAGKIDAIIEDVDGDIFIVEHKTSSNVSFIDTLGLSLDLQALFYMMLATSDTVTADIPALAKKPVSGFFYNAIQKPQHRMNDAGFQDLVNRMKNAMITDPSKYFSFTPVFVDRALMDRHRINIMRIIEQMDHLTPDTVCMNLTACKQYKGCEFKPLCQHLADAGKPEAVMSLPTIDLYEVRDSLHPELDEGDTDNASTQTTDKPSRAIGSTKSSSDFTERTGNSDRNIRIQRKRRKRRTVQPGTRSF